MKFLVKSFDGIASLADLPSNEVYIHCVRDSFEKGEVEFAEILKGGDK